MAETNPLVARHFAGRIAETQRALQGIHLASFADEITIVAPRDIQSFERFVYWTAALHEMLRQWAKLVEVRQTHSEETLTMAIESARVLAKDAQALWDHYQGQ